MGLFQSFQQVFVTNSPALLAEGKTVDSLAVGQIGILDAKTYKAVTAPTYAKNKALFAVWGTPDVNLGDFGGTPNENEYSKLIKGKLIRSFRASKAQRAQTALYTVGWSGDEADTDTLFAHPGESKSLYIKLSGTVIDRLYSTQGYTKQLVFEPSCIDACTDTCGHIKSPIIAKQLVEQISKDKDLSKFIRAKAIISCTGVTPPVETTCYKFSISVCDTGDDMALGMIQAKYPNEKISRISRTGAISVYGVVKNVNTTPAAFSVQGVIVPDCPTCPTGYTLTPKGNVFQVRVPHGEESPVETVGGSTATGILVSSDPSFDVWMVVAPLSVSVDTAISAGEAEGFTVTFLGEERAICTQTTPTTINWSAAGTLKKQSKAFRITLSDSVCGTNRLADLQAAYPDLVVSVVNASGSCVHTYETTVASECYETGCAVENIKFEAPAMFEGAAWKEVPAAPLAEDAECKSGILIETAFFNRKTNECTFDAFPYENDTVHVQISNYNPDFNGDPCEGEWVVKQIRGVKYPKGHGAYVRELEKKSKAYDQRHRSLNPVSREVSGYSFQADPSKFYDQYVLEYDTKWFSSGGWAESYTQTISLNFFVPEGTGSAIETAFNAYLSSAGIDEDGAVV